MSREVVFSAGKDITPENETIMIQALNYTLEGEEVRDKSLGGILGYYRERYNFEIVSYESITNERCLEMQETLRKHSFPGEAYKVGFHGTSYENIDSIVEDGLRQACQRSVNGRGVYISLDSFEAASYSTMDPNANFELAIFLVKYLEGAHMAQGTFGQVQYGKTADGQPIHTLTDGKNARVLKWENQGVAFGLLKMRWIDGTLIDPKQINDNMGGYGNPLLIRHLNNLNTLRDNSDDSLTQANKLKTTFNTMKLEEALVLSIGKQASVVKGKIEKELAWLVSSPWPFKSWKELSQYHTYFHKLAEFYRDIVSCVNMLQTSNIFQKFGRLKMLEVMEDRVTKIKNDFQKHSEQKPSEDQSGKQSGEHSGDDPQGSSSQKSGTLQQSRTSLKSPDSGNDPSQGSSSQGGTSQKRKPGEGGGPAENKHMKTYT